MLGVVGYGTMAARPIVTGVGDRLAPCGCPLVSPSACALSCVGFMGFRRRQWVSNTFRWIVSSHRSEERHGLRCHLRPSHRRAPDPPIDPLEARPAINDHGPNHSRTRHARQGLASVHFGCVLRAGGCMGNRQSLFGGRYPPTPSICRVTSTTQ